MSVFPRFVLHITPWVRKNKFIKNMVLEEAKTYLNGLDERELVLFCANEWQLVLNGTGLPCSSSGDYDNSSYYEDSTYDDSFNYNNSNDCYDLETPPPLSEAGTLTLYTVQCTPYLLQYP